MSRIEKTVFISYRRTNVPWALAIYQDLTQHGYDAFFDFQGIASGDFERVILENIRARAHFLVLLAPSALERCGDRGDWLRREIDTALEARRNDNRRAGLMQCGAVGVCLIIAALRKPAVSRQPRNMLAAYRPECRLVHSDRADLVRKINQSAKKNFRRDPAFLFSH